MVFVNDLSLKSPPGLKQSSWVVARFVSNSLDDLETLPENGFSKSHCRYWKYLLKQFSDEWSLLYCQLCHVIICFSVRGNSNSSKKDLVLAPLWGPLSLLSFPEAWWSCLWFSQLIKLMDLPFIGIRESTFLGLCLRVTGLCGIIVIKNRLQLLENLCGHLMPSWGKDPLEN